MPSVPAAGFVLDVTMAGAAVAAALVLAALAARILRVVLRGRRARAERAMRPMVLAVAGGADVQRARQSQVLAEALWAQRAMLLNPSYGRIGMLVLPFYLVFELGSALVELLAIGAIAAGLLLGLAGPALALLFAAAALGYGAFLTIVGVITEELTYHRYHSWRDLALLIYAAVAESAGFRQLHAWWRVRGMACAVLRHRANWAEEPGMRGQDEPVFGMPAAERHAGVR